MNGIHEMSIHNVGGELLPKRLTAAQVERESVRRVSLWQVGIVLRSLRVWSHESEKIREYSSLRSKRDLNAVLTN